MSIFDQNLENIFVRYHLKNKSEDYYIKIAEKLKSWHENFAISLNVLLAEKVIELNHCAISQQVVKCDKNNEIYQKIKNEYNEYFNKISEVFKNFINQINTKIKLTEDLMQYFTNCEKEFEKINSQKILFIKEKNVHEFCDTNSNIQICNNSENGFNVLFKSTYDGDIIHNRATAEYIEKIKYYKIKQYENIENIKNNSKIFIDKFIKYLDILRLSLVNFVDLVSFVDAANFKAQHPVIDLKKSISQNFKNNMQLKEFFRFIVNNFDLSSNDSFMKNFNAIKISNKTKKVRF